MIQDRILILDLGSTQNTDLARDIRGLGVYSEIHPHAISLAELRQIPGVKGIILNGGPNCFFEGEKITAAPEIRSTGVPVLAIDYQGSKPWPEDGEAGMAELKDFVFNNCKAKANWTVENFVAHVDTDKCTGCGKCREVCPIGCIELITLGEKA